MKILVTGAAGFIGSHVCENYIEQGHFVVGIDNFDDFYPKRFKLFNLIGLKKNSRFQLYDTDIRDKIFLNSIFSSNKIDAVIHLAAKAGVRPSINSIEDYYDVNVNGTISLLDRKSVV
jgi:UDP-glucuronate 4-epimerase